MDKILYPLLFFVMTAIGGFYLIKTSYKPNSNNYRGKILGPILIICSLVALYKVLVFFWGR